MCGVAGIYKKLEFYEEPKTVNLMLQEMINRGPDDGGVFSNRQISLGSRRLEILDPKGGKQPITDDTGCCLVFNGQIYNHLKLRNRIKNYRWKSNSDSETLFKLIQQDGITVINELHGMFAFAFWHADKKQLLIGRDQFGEKPLYYCDDSEKFIFASTCDALLAANKVSRELSIDSASQMLLMGFILPNQTIYENVKEFPPRSYGIVEENRFTVTPYKTKEVLLEPVNENFAQLVHRGKQVFEEVINEITVADVPLGTFLSGGVDSSLIAGLAKSRLKVALTASFETNSSDVKSAIDLSDNLGLKLNIVKMSDTQIQCAFDRTMIAVDQPFSDSAAIPLFLLSEKAKQDVGVCLTGDGADELFGGYDWRYSPISINESSTLKCRILGTIPEQPLKYVGFALRMLKMLRLDAQLQILRNSRTYSSIGPSEQKLAYFEYNYLSGISLKNMKLFQESDFWETFDSQSKFDLDWALDFDQSLYLNRDILFKTDRTSMINSLEVRAPFLHPKIGEFAKSVPAEFKVNGFATKSIIRSIYGNLNFVPLKSRRKLGLGGPVKKWVSLPSIQNHYLNGIKHPIIEQALNVLAATAATNNFQQRDHIKWNIACLNSWLQIRKL